MLKLSYFAYKGKVVSLAAVLIGSGFLSLPTTARETKGKEVQEQPTNSTILWVFFNTPVLLLCSVDLELLLPCQQYCTIWENSPISASWGRVV